MIKHKYIYIYIYMNVYMFMYYPYPYRVQLYLFYEKYYVYNIFTTFLHCVKFDCILFNHSSLCL